MKPTYGSSGKFFSQIANAPFDVFLSADVKFATQLVDKGRAEKDSVFPYAVGHIVLWVPKDSKIVIGVPLAWWLATTTWRGRLFVEAVLPAPAQRPGCGHTVNFPETRLDV